MVKHKESGNTKDALDKNLFYGRKFGKIIPAREEKTHAYKEKRQKHV